MATSSKDLAGNDAMSPVRGGAAAARSRCQPRLLAASAPRSFKLGRRRCLSRCHFKMFTARATTSKATTSEIASSAIIISFIHGRIAETSVGLNAVAVANEKWK